MAQSSLGGHSAACCSIPPVVASGYQAKGSYEQVAGLKMYVTGPQDATKAIMMVMDIFGYYDQSIQGADILATSDKDNKYRVFVPNFFNGGEPADLSWFPPNNEEKQKKLGDWFGKNPPQKVAESMPSTVKAIEEQYSNIKSWAIAGFCWGGKITTFSVKDGSTSPFSVAAVCHPAMVDPEDASSISIPFAMLASKDESADDVKKFVANLQGAKTSEIYQDQIHGWMAARADLTDEKVRKEYERGYTSVLAWFGQHGK